MALSAAGNVIIARKLTAVPPMVSTVIFSIVVALAAIVACFFHKDLNIRLTVPSLQELSFIILCGVFYFFADYLFFLAYHKGGTLGVVTTVVAIFPVCAAVINVATGGELPKLTQLGGAVLGIVAVYLATL